VKREAEEDWGADRRLPQQVNLQTKRRCSPLGGPLGILVIASALALAASGGQLQHYVPPAFLPVVSYATAEDPHGVGDKTANLCQKWVGRLLGGS